MVLFVVGDVNPESIRDIVETHENKRDKTNQPSIERATVDEPTNVITPFVSEEMKLQSPRLMLGFKMNQLKRHHEYVQHDLEMTLFFELIFGEETEDFIELY